MKPPLISDSFLRREIGKVGIATIAMNGVIGSGIFALPAVAIAQAGYFSPWVCSLCDPYPIRRFDPCAGRQFF